jgi:hypothetical protein
MSATFANSGTTTFSDPGGTGAFFTRSGMIAILSGNALASMSNVGPTSNLVTAYLDDTGTAWNLPIDFYFLGTNYGRNLNGGMCWDSNYVIGFSLVSGTITWPSTQPGILLGGNTDRATNSLFYSNVLTYGSATYINCLVRGQNIYNDGVPNALRYQFRFIRDAVYQYIEIRVEAGASTAGTWNIAGGPAGGNVVIATGTAVGTGQSGVWRSSLVGTGWTWFANSYTSIP